VHHPRSLRPRSPDNISDSESHEGRKRESDDESSECDSVKESREGWRWRGRKTPPPLPENVARPALVEKKEYDDGEGRDLKLQHGVYVVQRASGFAVRGCICGREQMDRPWEKVSDIREGEKGKGKREERYDVGGEEDGNGDKEEKGRWVLPPTMGLEDGLLFRKVG